MLEVEAKHGVNMNGRCVWVGVEELEVRCVHVVDLVDLRMARSLCIGQRLIIGNLMRCGH